MGCLPFLVIFNFISYQTGNILFSQPAKLTAQGRSQNQKLTLLHGGFVFLLQGKEFTASGVYVLRYDIYLCAFRKNFKAVNNFLKAHKIICFFKHPVQPNFQIQLLATRKLGCNSFICVAATSANCLQQLLIHSSQCNICTY